ncbi:MAG: formate transporter FocA [Candidatus Limnocylindrales bacterium]
MNDEALSRDGLPQLDVVLPPEMARRAEEVGARKADLDAFSTLALAVLAGAFIALGAAFATTVSSAATALPFGVTRILAGLAFSLGLILVVVAGAELFTGNNLIVMAWASRRVSTRGLLRNWILVYIGNFAGALATAVIIFVAGQYRFGGGEVGRTALSIADGKVGLDFVQAIALGAMCNALVCLAVWLTYSARSTADRILSIVPPIAAFVALGFEHSVANMYFIPLALLIRGGAPQSFWTAIGSSPDAHAGLTWGNFLVDNLLPVTIGNIVGGGVMVAGVYWLIYLRGSRPRRT